MKVLREYNYIREEKNKQTKKVVILTMRDYESPGNLSSTVAVVAKELKKRSIDHYILFVENALVEVDNGTIKCYNVDDHKGYEINKNDTVVLNRITTSETLGGIGIVSQLEKNGFNVVNSRDCVETCADKYRTVLRLAENGITVPKTILIQDEDVLDRVIGGLSFPIVVKTLTGSEGVGVFISESKMNLKSVLQAVWKLREGTEVILQNFIETDGDIRAFFIDGEYTASMKRIKIKDDFRSNFSLGGDTEKYTLTPEQIQICKKCCKIVGGSILGIDMMIAKDDTVFVIEVNSSPGTTGIMKTSGVNVAGKMIDYLMTL